MNENVPISLAIIGAILILSQAVSCGRAQVLARIPVEMEYAKRDVLLSQEMIRKGYFRNKWGNWEKERS